MEIKVIRKHFLENCTISEVSTNIDKQLFTCLEDKDRGLYNDMTDKQVAAVKVHGVTAIPYGRYQVIMSKSNRFGIVLPELLNVKGFAGVRMHVGNYPTDSEGCLLVGTGADLEKGMITNSKVGFGALYKLMDAAYSKKDTIWLTITKEVNTNANA